ncbi:hypothetical protein [Salinispora arenicola]|uniref:hypothetical protein n=1 Tax=Salinispora arenicola TaxID=168697 RepID=UPI0009B77785|nr:hypothetical protein [Salinispora arenicola]
MSDLVIAARELVDVLDVGDSPRASEAAREFVESITFASADEITSMLREVLAEDWMGLPPWARNLAYRLACLQRPNDAELLREAAADLLAFGPDWDAQAAILKEAATRREKPLR